MNAIGFSTARLVLLRRFVAGHVSPLPGNDTATVWVNGVEAGGHHEHSDLGWDQRFPIDVSGKLVPDRENSTAIRVGNELFAGGIWKSIKRAVSKE